MIDLFGIRNHFVTADQIPYHGIPFPGTYLVDGQGIVSAEFFRRNFAQRDAAEAVIDRALGEILLGEDEPSGGGGSDGVRISATDHGGGGKLRAGEPRQIVVRFDLDPGLHIYGEPVPQGMVATRLQVEGPEGLRVGETIAPATHGLTLPGLDFELQVWDGRVDFVVPVYADDRIASLVDEVRDDEISIDVRIDYQACDDRSCRLPLREEITLRVPLAPHVGIDLAGGLAGTVASTMNSRKYLLRMIWRSWRRRPIAGLLHLVSLWLDLRRGPAGSRSRSPR